MALGTGVGRSLVGREGTRAEWWRDCPEPGKALGTLGSVLETLPVTAAGKTRGWGAGVTRDGCKSPNPLPMRPTLEQGPWRARRGRGQFPGLWSEPPVSVP